MSTPFYVTTAIDYVNGRPHLGHVYEKITADVLARWHRLLGDDVRFLLGTDEHGIKVERTAAEQGLSPQAYVDSLVPAFKETFAAYDLSFDRFIRTEKRRFAQELVRKDYGFPTRFCEEIVV